MFVNAKVADASVPSTAASTTNTPGVSLVKKVVSAMPLAVVWTRMKVLFGGSEPGKTPAMAESGAAKITLRSARGAPPRSVTRTLRISIV